MGPRDASGPSAAPRVTRTVVVGPAGHGSQQIVAASAAAALRTKSREAKDVRVRPILPCLSVRPSITKP